MYITCTTRAMIELKWNPEIVIELRINIEIPIIMRYKKLICL